MDFQLVGCTQAFFLPLEETEGSLRGISELFRSLSIQDVWSKSLFSGDRPIPILTHVPIQSLKKKART